MIYHASVRTCAKIRCEAEPVSTVGLSYEARVVVIGDLTLEPNPNLLDLCSEHTVRLTPPIGWAVRDERTPAAAAFG